MTLKDFIAAERARYDSEEFTTTEHRDGSFTVPNRSMKFLCGFFDAHKECLDRLEQAAELVTKIEKELFFITTGHERDGETFEAHYSNYHRLKASRLAGQDILALIEAWKREAK